MREYERLTATESDFVINMIQNTSIVEYGVIKEIYEDDTALVELAKGENKQEGIKNTILKILYPTTNAISIKYELENEKVLCLFPRTFNIDMASNAEDKKDNTYFDNVFSYSALAGFCIPLSELNENSKNQLAINKDGDISFKNDKCEISIDNDGGINIISNENTKIEIDNNGNITLKANGKISIKNNSQNLKSILDDIIDKSKAVADNLQVAKTIPAVVGSPLTFSPDDIAKFLQDSTALSLIKTSISSLLQ